jgi:hypothetical protein
MVLRRFAASRRSVIAAVVAVACRLSSSALPPEIAEKPFAPHQPRGATMFAQLPADQTGIKTENKFADPKMKGELYQEFETSSIGTGVAIGDYDGDGRPDVFVVSKTESCRLFHNLGNFKFEDVTEKAGVADIGPAAMIWKLGATWVDVNNDGLLDLYVCRARAPNLLYINQGDGTFKEMAHSYGLDVNDSSVMAAFCDYDRDGWLDVYIATNILDISKHPNGQRGYLFHNNRDGTFTNVTDQAGMSGEMQSHSATWWDYDNDGWPDLYVALDYGVPDKLYHNNHDGTFTDMIDQVPPHTSFSSMGADLGDVNNDGLIDFLVADMAGTNHVKDQHMIADARGRTEERPDSMTSTPKYHRNALLLNTNTPHSLEAGYLAGVAATDWTWSIRFEDLDNDGRLDLFVTNGFQRDPGVDVIARMQTAESPLERIRIMYASPPQAENNFALRNLGDLAFENVSAAWGLNQKGVKFGTAFGDLDGDGNLDIVYANYHDTATVLRNDCDTGHRVIFDLRGTTSNRFGVGTKITIESALGKQVRQLVLARGYMSSSEPALHFGLGNDTAIRTVKVSWPSGAEQTFSDLAVDRRYTVTEPKVERTTPAVPAPAPSQFQECTATVGLAIPSREEAIDEIATQRLLPHKLNRRGPAIAVGDIAGTSRQDIVIGGTTLESAKIVRAASGGYAAPAAVGRVVAGDSHTAGTAHASQGSADMEVDDGPVLLFDADGDGHADLLVTKGGNSLPAGATEYQPKLFLNDGHGGFRPADDDALPALSVNAGAAAAADFDRDGKLDVFIGGRVVTGQYPQAPQSALLVNRGGKFEDVTETVAPGLKFVGMVTAALWSDVDGDGWPDLLLTLEWGQVKYFHNNGGKQLEDWTEKSGFASAGTGWWTSIASADFNGDGRMDYVIGNVGLNTQYHADPAHPALLYSGDFKGDGSNQLIEAYYEGDKIYPWRTWREMTTAFPALAKRYRRNDAYAPETLAAIFGQAKLDAADKYAATELRSGVLLSRADGTYAFEPLPRLAQISPFDGIVTGDFDGDGFADIYVVQNSYSPIPAVGRFDGGLSQLLTGDGHGHFRAVPVAESGLIVPGDAKGLVAVDLDDDGWADFVLTRNNATAMSFRNRGVPGRHGLRVELAGSAGNPTGIGSRVTLELADGSKQVAEVSAGSGYYSQSTAACWFGYPRANPPKHIEVRWPDGTTSDHPVAADATKVLIKR